MATLIRLKKRALYRKRKSYSFHKRYQSSFQALTFRSLPRVIIADACPDGMSWFRLSFALFVSGLLPRKGLGD